MRTAANWLSAIYIILLILCVIFMGLAYNEYSKETIIGNAHFTLYASASGGAAFVALIAYGFAKILDGMDAIQEERRKEGYILEQHKDGTILLKRIEIVKDGDAAGSMNDSSHVR